MNLKKKSPILTYINGLISGLHNVEIDSMILFFDFWTKNDDDNDDDHLQHSFNLTLLYQPLTFS